MIKIRLARGGAKKRPYYSIVVADSHSPRDGRFIDQLGYYKDAGIEMEFEQGRGSMVTSQLIAQGKHLHRLCQSPPHHHRAHLDSPPDPPAAFSRAPFVPRHHRWRTPTPFAVLPPSCAPRRS